MVYSQDYTTFSWSNKYAAEWFLTARSFDTETMISVYDAPDRYHIKSEYIGESSFGKVTDPEEERARFLHYTEQAYQAAKLCFNAAPIDPAQIQPGAVLAIRDAYARQLQLICVEDLADYDEPLEPGAPRFRALLVSPDQYVEGKSRYEY